MKGYHSAKHRGSTAGTTYISKSVRQRERERGNNKYIPTPINPPLYMTETFSLKLDTSGTALPAAR